MEFTLAINDTDRLTIIAGELGEIEIFAAGVGLNIKKMAYRTVVGEGRYEQE